jgi:hypothetical protein
MKQPLLIGFLLLCAATQVWAQTLSYQAERNVGSPRHFVVNPLALGPDYAPTLLHVAPPPGVPSRAHLAARKAVLDHRRDNRARQSQPAAAQRNTAFSLVPDIDTVFVGNTWGFSLPNDNDIAVSNGGWVVSVINTNISVFDTLGNLQFSQSLANFGAAVGGNAYPFDPRVVYDPDADRFILTYLSGFTDSTNLIILAFSQTNDPTGPWHLYALDGNPLNNGTWSDFPTLSVGSHDVFLCFNTFTNGSQNNSGFTESVFWQIAKADGYAGDSLQSLYYHNITLAGDTMFNFCPIDGAGGLYGPEHYLVSSRLLAEANDTLFVFRVSNSVASGSAQLSLQTVVMDKPYGLPPSGVQPHPTKRLDTNDARVLMGFLHNGKIQLVMNSVMPQDSTAGIYYAVVQVDPPISTGSAFYVDGSLWDVAYPGIAWVGPGHEAILTCLLSSDFTYPSSAMLAVTDTAVFPEPTAIYIGTHNLNVSFGDPERWGDYTGLCPRYNRPRELWFSGSFGGNNPLNDANLTCIARLSLASPAVGAAPTISPQPAATRIFPNPVGERFTVEVNLPQATRVSFTLCDATGRPVRVLLDERLKAGTTQFGFQTGPLSPGVYLLRVQPQGQPSQTHRVVVQ